MSSALASFSPNADAPTFVSSATCKPLFLQIRGGSYEFHEKTIACTLIYGKTRQAKVKRKKGGFSIHTDWEPFSTHRRAEETLSCLTRQSKEVGKHENIWSDFIAHLSVPNLPSPVLHAWSCRYIGNYFLVLLIVLLLYRRPCSAH